MRPVSVCTWFTALALVGALATAGGAHAQGKPIVIGVIGDFTGPTAAYTTAGYEGAVLAVEDVNAKGGVNGQKVELKQYDCKNDPVEAVNSAKRVGDEALMVFTPGPSTCVLAMGATLDRARLPFIATVAANPKVTESGWKFVSRVHLSDRDQVGRLVNYAVNEQKFKRIAILYDTSDFGVGGRDLARQALDKLGLKPVVDEGWKQTDMDFSSQVLKLREANAQGVVLWGAVEGATRIVLEMRRLGLKDVQVYGGGGLVTQKYIDLGRDAVEGTIATWAYLDPSSPRASGLAKRYKEKFGREMDVFVAQSYDAVTIAAEAIGKAGTTPDKRQAIQNAIRGAKHEGVVGYIEFDQTGHNLRKIYLARLSGGKWKVLE